MKQDDGDGDGDGDGRAIRSDNDCRLMSREIEITHTYGMDINA